MSNWQRTRRVAAVTATTGVVLTAGHSAVSRQGDFEGPTLQPAAATRLVGQYGVILGDSLASGAGALQFDPTSTGVFGHACFRSEKAGAVLALIKAGLDAVNLACDGAGIGTLDKLELPEFDAYVAAKGEPADVVLSIGTNEDHIDLTNAATDELANPAYHFTTSKQFIDALHLLKGHLEQQFDKIWETAPHTRIVLLGDPYVFGEHPNHSILTWPFDFTAGEQNQFTLATKLLNNIFKQAVNDTAKKHPGKIAYVDLTDVIEGVHSRRADVVGLTWPTFMAQFWDFVQGTGVIPGLSQNSNFHPGHPNEIGNREMAGAIAPELAGPWTIPGGRQTVTVQPRELSITP